MLNNIILQGRLTRDPEMKATATGISLVTFALACERDYKITSGEGSTDFFDVVAWRGTADFIQRNFHKGQMVIVNGRLQTRQWTAEDGSKRARGVMYVLNHFEKALTTLLVGNNITKIACAISTVAQAFFYLNYIKMFF